MKQNAVTQDVASSTTKESAKVIAIKPRDMTALVSRRDQTTTSLLIAEKFEKEHRNVLLAIRNLEGLGCPQEFVRLNFKQTSYTDSLGRKQPCCTMTRDGFVMLTMGFTGRKAMQWKILFSEAFNQMEAIIRHIGSPEWNSERDKGKTARKFLVDTINTFVAYATGQGSTNAKTYFTSITKAVNTAVFPEKSATALKFDRDALSESELYRLSIAEYLTSTALVEAMADGLPYKDVFKVAKSRVKSFVQATGGNNLMAVEPSLQLPEVCSATAV